jgi:hypothetical protein
MFDADALLEALPRTFIRTLPRGTAVPRRRSFGDLNNSYNGFTGKERMRTSGVAKWLVEVGALARSSHCGICGSPAAETHAEDYYDLSSWIDVCRGCHRSLHSRFNSPGRWADRLDGQAVPPAHWSRLVSREPFDLAALFRQRGEREPVYETFVQQVRAQGA